MGVAARIGGAVVGLSLDDPRLPIPMNQYSSKHRLSGLERVAGQDLEQRISPFFVTQQKTSQTPWQNPNRCL